MRSMSDDRLRTEGLSDLYVESSSAGVVGVSGTTAGLMIRSNFRDQPLGITDAELEMDW